MESAANIDPREKERFEESASDWWKVPGPHAALHRMNPARLDLILEQLAARFHRDRSTAAPLSGLRILDVGCGGGLIAEPLARLGAEVVGIDPAEACIEVARAHAAQHALDVDYRVAEARDLVAVGDSFDAVLCMDVIEHVPSAGDLVRDCAALLATEGLLVISTLNRSPRSWVLGIVAAEHVLRWVPRGTHDWRKFLRPDELRRMMTENGLTPVVTSGLVYDPLTGEWRCHESNFRVNYAVAAVRREAG